ncbi:hypothetical protein BJV82DRAFT_717969 [Fennellomyces sp. T-0311]|nr:hypothetical protein BJV82DRAFT_717969 [Fennellomyces sp. T-0311]
MRGFRKTYSITKEERTDTPFYEAKRHPSVTSFKCIDISRIFPGTKIGFAQKFNDIPELITTIDSRVPDAPNPENSMIEILPEQLVENNITRATNVYCNYSTWPGGWSVLLTANNQQFALWYTTKITVGRCPSLSMGPLKASLRNQLRDKYGFLRQPTPYVNPVHHQFFKGQNETMIDIHGLTSTVKGSEDQPLDVLAMKGRSQHDHIPQTGPEGGNPAVSLTEFQYLQQQLDENRKLTNDLLRRAQLTELMNKAYYIDDELYQCLNAAHQEENDNLPGDNNIKTNDPLQQLRIQQQSRYPTKKKGFIKLFGRSNEEADSVRSSRTAWSEQILLEDKGYNT